MATHTLRPPIWGLLAVLLLSPVPALATVSFDFQATAFGMGPYTGNTYFGSFSYDETVLTNSGFETLDPTFGTLTVDLTFEGTPFDETNDVNYFDVPQFPTLTLLDGAPDFLDYLLVAGFNGVSFGDPDILAVAVIGPLTPIPGAQAYAVDMLVDLVPVPTPAAVALFAIGLAGLGYQRQKQRG